MVHAVVASSRCVDLQCRRSVSLGFQDNEPQSLIGIEGGSVLGQFEADEYHPLGEEGKQVENDKGKT